MIKLTIGHKTYTDAEFLEDRVMFIPNSTAPRLGRTRTMVSYRTLARWLERGIASIEGFVHLPREIQAKINALRATVPPRDDRGL